MKLPKDDDLMKAFNEDIGKSKSKKQRELERKAELVHTRRSKRNNSPEYDRAKKAYKLAKQDAKQIIKDAKKQRKQAKLQLRIAKMQAKLIK